MLRPLEPATGQSLARDLVLKTRRRKGLGDGIAVSKYLEQGSFPTFSFSPVVACRTWADFNLIFYFGRHDHRSFRLGQRRSFRLTVGENKNKNWIYLRLFFSFLSFLSLLVYQDRENQYDFVPRHILSSSSLSTKSSLCRYLIGWPNRSVRTSCCSPLQTFQLVSNLHTVRSILASSSPPSC